MDQSDVFVENYMDGGDTDSDDGLMEDLDISAGKDDGNDEFRLGITAVQAKANYDIAGTEVEEEKDGITIQDNADLMNYEVNNILNEVVQEIQMPYQPAEFQRVAINALGGMKNVVLVSPTGSGKMNVPLLSTLVLRKVLGIPRGVCIVTQPLSSIMHQKMINDVCPAAVLSMGGGLTVSTQAGEEDDGVKLSCNLDDLLHGSYPVLFGHPESFDSKLGQHILRQLQKLDRLILLCIDEFHQVL